MSDLTPTPHDPSAELAALGSAILEPAALDVITKSLISEDFYVPMHRVLFEAMRTKGVGDPVTLANYLDSKEGEDKGFRDLLVDCMEAVPSAKNAPHYCRVLKEMRYRRNVLSWAGKARMMASQGDAKELQSWLSYAPNMARATESMHIKDVPFGKGETGVTTGFPTIDKLSGHVGYIDGQISAPLSYRGGGKTSYMLTSTLKIAEGGDPVHYASFADLTPAQLKRRMYRQLTGYGFPQNLDDHEEAAQRLESMPIFFYDGKTEGRTIEDYVSAVYYRESKKPARAYFVDYLQRIRTTERFKSIYDRQCYVTERLTELTEDIGKPLVVASQVTFGGDGEVKSKMGVELEENAGLVIHVKRDKDNPSMGNLVITKSRFGEMYVECKVGWDETRVRYYEVGA